MTNLVIIAEPLAASLLRPIEIAMLAWKQQHGYHEIESLQCDDPHEIITQLSLPRSRTWGIALCFSGTEESVVYARSLVLELRRQERFDRCPIILISAITEQDMVDALKSSTTGIAARTIEQLDVYGCFFVHLPVILDGLATVLKQAQQFTNHSGSDEYSTVSNFRVALSTIMMKRSMENLRHDEEGFRAALRILQGGLLEHSISITEYKSILQTMCDRNPDEIRFCRHANEHLRDLPEQLPSSNDSDINTGTQAGPSPLRLLLIDDQALRLAWDLILQTSLGRRLNAEVTVATDLDVGVDMASSGNFDLLLLDLNFDGKASGITALQAIRESKPWLPIVIFTGEDYYRTLETCARLRVEGIFLKELRERNDRRPEDYFTKLVRKIALAVEKVPRLMITDAIRIAFDQWLKTPTIATSWTDKAAKRIPNYLEQSVLFWDDPRIALMFAGLAFEEFAYTQQEMTPDQKPLGDIVQSMIDKRPGLAPFGAITRICTYYRNNVMHSVDDLVVNAFHQIDVELYLWGIIALLRTGTGTTTNSEWASRVIAYYDCLAVRIRELHSKGLLGCSLEQIEICIADWRLLFSTDTLHQKVELEKVRDLYATLIAAFQRIAGRDHITDGQSAAKQFIDDRKSRGLGSPVEQLPWYSFASIFAHEQLATFDVSDFDDAPENRLFMVLLTLRVFTLMTIINDLQAPEYSCND
ncbi:MAG TPA: response regulator [Capsulimonadaceae bacterium]|jgi:hypothetical protein